ncbi:hypothetical protein [Streptomyces albidochromogenes]|uniref:Uncharacterized protein n=1 Tax=Streptomyces albidochromogenes TaxID=329524 RepID=A0ABW6FU68_9ACTN
MAVRFAAVGVAALLALPASGAYADERPPGPPHVSAPSATTPPGDAGERDLLPGVAAPDRPERPERPAASAASPTGTLAGRPAGEGRRRPGRPPAHSADPGRDEEADEKASPSPSASPSGGARVSPSASASGSASAPASSPAAPRKSYAPESWDVHEEALDEADQEPAAPTSDRPPGAAPEGSEQVVAQSDPLGVHVLPLGAGLTLMGLGLGFLGLRLRRG